METNEVTVQIEMNILNLQMKNGLVIEQVLHIEKP